MEAVLLLKIYIHTSKVQNICHRRSKEEEFKRLLQGWQEAGGKGLFKPECSLWREIILYIGNCDGSRLAAMHQIKERFSLYTLTALDLKFYKIKILVFSDFLFLSIWTGRLLRCGLGAAPIKNCSLLPWGAGSTDRVTQTRLLNHSDWVYCQHHPEYPGTFECYKMAHSEAGQPDNLVLNAPGKPRWAD